MSDTTSKHYYAKVLLFGEYTIMDGSAAVAIPFEKFGGNWSRDKNNSVSKKGLEKLKAYLATEYYKGNIDHVDFDKFERDITRGLVFDSSIPTGYGLGSSGALTAAFFDNYVTKTKQYNLPELKSILSLIESCFHGSSSGLDPLVSLLNMPLMVHPEGSVEIIDGDKSHFLEKLRLLDTEKSRATAPLVNTYKLTREENPEFYNDTKQLAELTDQLIVTYILDQENEYAVAFKRLSTVQLAVLPMLIPQKYRSLWQDGLDLDAFYMKLCGAGGGGYLMMHINSEELAKKLLKDHNILSII